VASAPNPSSDVARHEYPSQELVWGVVDGFFVKLVRIFGALDLEIQLDLFPFLKQLDFYDFKLQG